nr:MAG TPA: hypothetical protein [Caudoviricetes sp.]
MYIFLHLERLRCYFDSFLFFECLTNNAKRPNKI